MIFSIVGRYIIMIIINIYIYIYIVIFQLKV